MRHPYISLTRAVVLATAALIQPAPVSAEIRGPWELSTASSRIALADVALFAAPVLWFSPDEPLWDQTPVPAALPCDPEAGDGRRVVYYVASALAADRALAPDELAALREEYLPLAALRSFSVTFVFYYPMDLGFGGHVHDVEGARFDLQVRHEAGRHTVSIDRVTGFAHGARYLWNILDVTDAEDVRFPITLLVEEGKHATCPDRNADGHYTPGYDVNLAPNDAWGVRDVLGTGLLRTAFESWHAKNRALSASAAFDRRVGPPLKSSDSMVVDYSGPLGWPSAAYLLRSGHITAVCDAAGQDRSLGRQVAQAIGLSGNTLDLSHALTSLGMGRPPTPPRRPWKWRWLDEQLHQPTEPLSNPRIGISWGKYTAVSVEVPFRSPLAGGWLVVGGGMAQQLHGVGTGSIDDPYPFYYYRGPLFIPASVPSVRTATGVRQSSGAQLVKAAPPEEGGEREPTMPLSLEWTPVFTAVYMPSQSRWLDHYVGLSTTMRHVEGSPSVSSPVLDVVGGMEVRYRKVALRVGGASEVNWTRRDLRSLRLTIGLWYVHGS